MKNNLKICIISIYFGKLPEWFDIWVCSAAYNKKVDFLFVTDQKVDFSFPNIKVLEMSFDNFRKLAKRKLKFNIKLNTPYKLCDYKMVWGKILEDELKGYNYWGECDNDIIFGDLLYFFNKYDLIKYDKFGCRGHLTLYRNSEEVISRYRLKGGWFGSYKEVFSSNKIWAFDETPGINAIYNKYNFPSMDKILFADIDVNYEDIRLVEFENSQLKNYDKQIFYWQDGKIYRAYYENGMIKNNQFMYIHLQKRKMAKPDFNPFDNNPFIITNGKFIKKNYDIDEKLIKKYNLKNDVRRTKKVFGGAYKKDLRFFWLGRRILNLIYEIKKMIKRTKFYKFIKR